MSILSKTISPNQKNITKNYEKESVSVKGLISVESYRHFVDLFYQNKEPILHTHLYNNVKLISFKEGEIEINVDSISDKSFIRTIAKLISKILIKYLMNYQYYQLRKL